MESLPCGVLGTNLVRTLLLCSLPALMLCIDRQLRRGVSACCVLCQLMFISCCNPVQMPNLHGFTGFSAKHLLLSACCTHCTSLLCSEGIQPFLSSISALPFPGFWNLAGIFLPWFLLWFWCERVQEPSAKLLVSPKDPLCPLQSWAGARPSPVSGSGAWKLSLPCYTYLKDMGLMWKEESKTQG